MIDMPERKPNENLQYQRKLRGWSQQRVAEEIGTLAKNVGRWERGESIPDTYYQEMLCSLFGMNTVELGFLETLNLSQSSLSSTQQNVSAGIEANASSQTNNALRIILLDKNGNIQPVETSPQILVVSSHMHDEMRRNDMERRDFLKLAAGATILSTTSNASDELLDRFFRALKKPSTLDTSSLLYLEKRTEGYWQDRHGAVLAASDLFSYVMEHFNRIVALLESVQSPATRMRMCTAASWTALLVGELLMDMSHYPQARKYHEAAITAAQEAGNTALQAVAWGRKSLGWIYSKDMKEALSCIQQARLIANTNANTTIRAWLAAIEAEIQASLSNAHACLTALDEAERFEDQNSSSEDSYMIVFDQALLRGYQGTSFRRLYHHDDSKSVVFLEKARSVLLDALTSLDPLLKQRQPTFLMDLADTYVLQGEVEEACRRANQALTLASEIKLQKVVKRLHELRQNLTVWNNTSYVQQHITLTLHPLYCVFFSIIESIS
jgi:transcriptional regulator with XRE-family HTH domain